MKIRTGFVSNSSSCSFIIDKTKLSELQQIAIRDHIMIGSKLNIEYACEEDAWEVREDDCYMRLSTFMDNFDMDEFLRRIQATDAVIEREHS